MYRTIALSLVCAAALDSRAVAQTQDQNPAVSDLKIALVCAGIGTRDDAQATYGQVYGGKSGPVFGSMTTESTAQAPEQLTIEIAGDGGRLHLPAWLQPAIHGGSDGWYKLSKVKVDSSSISGQFSINVLNHPKFSIDRHTGHIELNGFDKLAFNGSCEKAPDASAPTKF
jgi:hypothetical protein